MLNSNRKKIYMQVLNFVWGMYGVGGGSTVVPRYIAPRYIATLAYRHEIVNNGFPPMLIPPL